MENKLSKKDERIIALWKDGFSGSEVAATLGVTKGSIMGRLFRLRKMGVDVERDAPPSPPPEDKPAQKSPKKAKAARTIRVHYPPRPTPSQRAGEYLSIMDLKSDSCRYIVGVCEEVGHLYCGKEQARGAYCNHHADMCYTVFRNMETKRKKAAIYLMGGAHVRR